MTRVRSFRFSVVVVASAASIAGCTTKSETNSDSAQATMNGRAGAGMAHADSARMTGAMSKDSGGMGSMPGMGSSTGDPDHDFLRLMSDHHKGLILMVHETIETKDKVGVKPLASRMDKEQDTELDAMMSTLEKTYKDAYAPKVMAEHQSMADQLKGKSGADFDRTFLSNVTRHHEEAIKMIDQYLPTARQPAVKKMAERMKAAQTREITEMNARLATMKS